MEFKTQREFLEESRKRLKERFQEKYPNGKFEYSRLGSWLEKYSGPETWLSWTIGRTTSGGGYAGLGRAFSVTNARNYVEKNGILGYARGGVNVEGTRRFKTIDELIKYCIKKGVPEDLQNKFIIEYKKHISARS